MNDRQALMVLNAVPGLGTVGLEALLKYFSSPVKIFEAGYEDLARCSLGRPNVIENIIHFPKDKFLEDEYNLIQKKGVQIITILDEEYPRSLKEIPGAPHVLYLNGHADVLNKPGIGIVGSRIAGHYGKKVAEDFGSQFAQRGMNVISGLARGIDTAAHRGCLNAKGTTVAVIGCGFNHVYPAENVDLYAEIALQGAVITEYPMSVPPLSQNFPRRNRIISGLSQAVVVIEATDKSGALITVDYALEQGRDVFAVPGPIDMETCKGSNRLIKDGARVALAADDVLEGIGVHLKQQELFPDQEVPKFSLSPEESQGYGFIGKQPVHIDQIVMQSGWNMSQLSTVILNLELKHAIRQLPGQYYVRV